MEYASALGTQQERDCVGTTISFSQPPPPCLKNSLVARNIEDAAPFLTGTIGCKGEVSWEVRSPSAADLRIFALIMASRIFIGGRSTVIAEASKLARVLGTCKWRAYDHECLHCKTTTTGDALFIREASTADRHYKLCYSACTNPECVQSSRSAHIKTLVFKKPKKGKKKTEISNLEALLCTRLGKAIDTMRNKQMGKYGCVLDPRRIKYAQSGFPSDVAYFCTSTLDFMYTVNGNPDFSPQFATHDMRALYEDHVKLLSWHYPRTTMIHVPALGGRPPLDNPICRDFIANHRGDAIVNGNYTYMTCVPDRIQASDVCRLFFSKDMHSSISTKLYWNWPNSIENYHTEGFWYDPHDGIWRAPVPAGMTVCASLSDFIASMKTNISNNYIVANSQELDFIMMKTLLEAVSGTSTTLQFLGLVSPVGSTKEARMNGRPFIFFSWWNGQKPQLCRNPRHKHKAVCPPLDATMEELAIALRDGSIDPSHESILNAVSETWLYTHWNGIEYTTSPPPKRIRLISSFQKHECNYKTCPQNPPVSAIMRICNGTYSIRVSAKPKDAHRMYIVRNGSWSHHIRHGEWGVVPAESATLGIGDFWEIEAAPTAMLSRSLNLCGAVDPLSLSTNSMASKKKLTVMGLFLAAATYGGLTPALSGTLSDLLGGDHILTVHNSACAVAIAVAFDCYLAAVELPLHHKFVRPRNKQHYRDACERFDLYLNRAKERYQKNIAGTLNEIRRVYTLLPDPQTAQTSKRRKVSSDL